MAAIFCSVNFSKIVIETSRQGAYDLAMKQRRYLLKILIPLLILGAGIFVLAVGACINNSPRPSKPPGKAVYDRELGTLEKDILGKYGEPLRSSVKPAKDLRGDLGNRVKSMVPNGDTEVKELDFHIGTNQRYFWLTKQGDGEWKVIADVDIPPGAGL
jgi:hypothetical protein